VSRYEEGDRRDARLLAEIRAMLGDQSELARAARHALLGQLLTPYLPVIDGLTASHLYRLGREVVKEGVQEVWKKLLDEIESGKEWTVPFRAVVVARVDFTCRTIKRRHAKATDRETPVDELRDAATVDVEGVVMGEALLEWLRGQLRPDEWRLVEGSWIDPVADAELAEEFGVKVGALYTRRTRLREKLRELLDDQA
jgi:DNA-directed RNA polymerase specialized sigma24 family protein